jgi:hypothetical protein
MSERSFGARWWRESLATSRLARGGLAGTFGLLGGAAMTLPGCFNYAEPATDTTVAGQRGDEMDTSVDALALQKEQGWDVGQPGGTLPFADSSVEDVAGTQDWRSGMERLATTLHPPAPALQPYYVPTLFQALIGKAGQRLRAVMRPIHNDDMDRDFARGLALREAFGAAGFPSDTALVIDAPGPRSVALAAALADHFTPVFTFGNWPHPLGVVPAQETLAATLFYLPAFSAGQSARAIDAPPMFVLDANRLLPYRDADSQFDNRYFVQLPQAAALQALGVSHVLYVSADGHQELDDLNAALVDLQHNGVDVQMVALGDFVPAGETAPELAEAEQGSDDDDGETEAEYENEGVPDSTLDVGFGFNFFFDPWPWWLGHRWAQARYCYGGYAHGGAYRFWNDHGGYHRPPGHVVAHGGRVVGAPTGTRAIAGPGTAPGAGRVVAAPPRSVGRWSPTPRPTLFNPRGPAVGHLNGRVAGFGQVPVWASRSDGHVTAVRPGAVHNGGFGRVSYRGGFGRGVAFSGSHGSTSGRSGSIGRAGGGVGG